MIIKMLYVLKYVLIVLEDYLIKQTKYLNNLAKKSILLIAYLPGLCSKLTSAGFSVYGGYFDIQ